MKIMEYYLSGFDDSQFDDSQKISLKSSISMGAINAVRNGNLVECTKDEYENHVRSALQQQAGVWIDQSDHIHAQIALAEVQRLDKKFDINFFE